MKEIRVEIIKAALVFGQRREVLNYSAKGRVPGGLIL
jgi:hypothetical protein